MKQTIKVKVLTEGCEPLVNEKGDWFDLRAAEDVSSSGGQLTSTQDISFHSTYMPLGIAMKLPKGMEAISAPRSSSHKKFGILQTNSIGVIDNTYCGPNDQWYMPALMVSDCEIHKGDRICQFRIQLSQKATLWQKIKWLFSNGVKIEIVDDLEDADRGGLGSSGTK